MNQLQKPRTDEGRSQRDKGLMDWGGSIRSQAELTKAMQPRVCSFNDPSVNSTAAAVLGTAMRDFGVDATLSQFLAVRLRIVGAVGVQFVRPLAWMANLAL